MIYVGDGSAHHYDTNSYYNNVGEPRNDLTKSSIKIEIDLDK